MARFVRRRCLEQAGASTDAPSRPLRFLELLIDLARQMREAGARGEQLGLSDDELALLRRRWRPTNSAVKVLGDDTLKTNCPENSSVTVRKNVTIDWANPRQRAGATARLCEAHPAQVRLPA